MKVPTPRKLPSGRYYIQMRLGGESISVSDWDERKCIREAMAIKAEYKAGLRVATPKEREPEKLPTLTKAIDAYILERSNVLSPSTIRGYRIIQRNRFKAHMQTSLSDIPDDGWQAIINEEAKTCSPKTLANAFGLIRPVVEQTKKCKLPAVKLPAKIINRTAYLTPAEIPVFVEHVKDSPFAVPLLLALSACRISEIAALDWRDIPEDPSFIRIQGAMVPDEHHKYIVKKQNKTDSSARNVPILIPELTDAIKRERKPAGKVMACSQSFFRELLHDICAEAKITDVTPHGLRHSFASLAWFLGMPEEQAMDIGGWNDFGTMRRIYTHFSQDDITRYQGVMQRFYENKGKNPQE